MDTKVCRNCKEEKPFSEFSKKKSGKFGLTTICKPCDVARVAEWQERNPEKTKANNRKSQANYRKRNPEKVREQNREFRENNPTYKKEWQERNRDKVRAYARKHYAKGVQKNLERNRKRKARIRGNGFSPYTTEELLEKYGSNCYICGEEIDLTAPRWTRYPGWERGLHVEHVVDISLGGPDTIENVRPAHGLCNLKKPPTPPSQKEGPEDNVFVSTDR